MTPIEFKPHPYQAYAIQRMIETPCIGAMLDMGLGKTVITLTALHELKRNRWEIRKALVIAPKKVAESTWTTEAAKWTHLQDMRISVCLGSARERVVALSREADVYVINRENTQWLVEFYGRRWPFDVVVLDESSSFKNHRAKRFRALRAVRPMISRLIELTGTPSPHGLTDLWAQVFLLDGGQRLGRTITAYRDMYFIPDARNRSQIFTYKPKEGASEAIYSKISDICISMRAEDYLTMPDLIVDDILVELDKQARKSYTELERTMLLTAADESGEVVTASTAAVLTNKLLQLCSGAVYTESGEVVQVHDNKIEALLETLEQLHGASVVICYQFRHDLDRITAALSKNKDLQVRVYRNSDDLEAWNAGHVNVLLLHPASAGYGLNLQEGGHHIIWFTPTWNLEEYLQANARLYRQGQRYPVIVHRLLVRGGIDEDVARSLERKDGAQNALLDALRARISDARG